MTIGDITLDEAFDWDYENSCVQQLSLVSQKMEVDSSFPLQRSFRERVQFVSEHEKVSSFIVDSRVLVVGLSDQFRSLALKNWESKKEEASWWTGFYVKGAVTSVVLTAAALALFPPAAAVTATAAIAGAIFGYRSSGRDRDAQSQIDKWNVHPAQSLADTRTKAYKQGFFYCLNNDLKGSYGTSSSHNVLHPNEVIWLYEQSLANMMKDVEAQNQRRNISSSEMTKWIEGFIQENPLSQKAIAYAYDPQDPKGQILKAWNPSFEAYKQDVLSVKSYFAKKEEEVSGQAKKEINRLEEQRNLALAHPLAINRANNEEAKRIRDQQLAIKGISEYERREIVNEYNRTVKDNDNSYLTFANPINIYYNGCKKEVDEWKEDCLKKIEKESASEISRSFKPALELFMRAYASWTKQKYNDADFYKGHISLFNDFPPVPSAPRWEDLKN